MIRSLVFLYFLQMFACADIPRFEDVFVVDGDSPEIRKINSFYVNLVKLRSGKKIATKLGSLIRDGVAEKIRLKKSEKSSYSCRTNTLEFNIREMENKKVGCVIKKRTDDERYEIGEDYNPPHIVLGHELIHAIDFFTNPNYRTELTTYTGSLWGFNRRRLIPIEDFQGKPTGKKKILRLDNALWDKDVEQRAVIGEKNTRKWESCFTEFMLRIESGLRPRYAYQQAEDYFYENPEIIEDILETHLGDNWKAVFESTDARNVRFDAEKAEESRLSYKSPKTSPRDG